MRVLADNLDLLQHCPMHLATWFTILLLAIVESAAAEDKIHVWIRAFIPKQIEGNPTYMVPIPGRPGQSMISSPGLFRSNKFFATDHRFFDSSPDASSRLATEFVLVIDGSSVRIEKAGGRPFHRTSPTQRLTLDGSKVEAETKTADLKIAAMGQPMSGNGMVQIAGQAAAANPFLPAPWIDYSFDLIYKPALRELLAKVNIGAFPAFEGYASFNGGKPVTLFKGGTTIDHAAGLFDFGAGLNHRHLEEKVRF
jgi:hypothetical protein